ncbi:MAG: response regulator [Salinivirgaceae bacterium]|nr:response regulator [Salinivirgaceae bacterium]
MSKPRVLIVDDILVNRMLLSDIATSIGCECTLAKNGKEAIDLIMGNDFNMVIMDIEMPVMNGLETTSAIRKIEGRKSQIPVIALTAHDPADFFSEFSACGFNELITKPYLITKIQKLVDDFCR